MVVPEPALDIPEEEPVLLIAVNGIAFPVAGIAQYSASFGAPRPGGRSHEGVDIFAEKMTPVVAASDGTVSFVRDGVGTDCCVVKIRHDDGRASLYLHLNNDTPGTDDGLGYGLAEGIAVGVRVTAGTVIGYVGDSGNAEETPPHLHFELHNAGGVPVDPYPYLQIAQGAEPALFASALLEQPETLPATGAPCAALAVASVMLMGAGRLLTRSSRRRAAAVSFER
jgi:murein DD-endopeptidase MepM/ murein hydrolase activator NlpD